MVTSDLVKSQLPSEVIEQRMPASQEKIFSVSVYIYTCFNTIDDNVIGDDSIPFSFHLFLIVSAIQKIVQRHTSQ